MSPRDRMPLRPLNLRTRLALGLAVICLVLLVPLALSLRSLAGLRGEISAFGSQEFIGLARMAALRDLAGEIRERETSLLALRDRAGADALEESLGKLRAFARDTGDGHAAPPAVEQAVAPLVSQLLELLPREISAVREPKFGGEPYTCRTMAPSGSWKVSRRLRAVTPSTCSISRRKTSGIISGLSM